MSNEIVIFLNDLLSLNFNDSNSPIDNYWDILVGFLMKIPTPNTFMQNNFVILFFNVFIL